MFNSIWNSPLNIYSKPDILSTQQVLKEFNETLNKNYIDSEILMNISITGTKNIPPNNDIHVISSEFNKKLSEQLGINIPKNINGIFFSNNSSLAKNISNSQEFLNLVKAQKRYGFKNKVFPVSFNQDRNLFLGLHNATAVNPYFDNEGYFNVMIYDNYDFDKSKYKNSTDILNNSAYALQQTKNLEKYYFIVPLRFKLPF